MRNFPIGRTWASNIGNPFIVGTAAFNESFNDGKPEDVIWIKTYNPVTRQPTKRRITPPIQINAMSATERNFGDRVDIPSLHRNGSEDIRLGAGQVERMYDIPLRDIPGLRLDKDMRNAVVRVATVFWEPGDWLTLESDGTKSKGATRLTKQNVGVAFLRRVAGPSKDAQGNIDKLSYAQSDLYATRGGDLNPETRDAPGASEEFWMKRRGPSAEYITRIPPPLFDPGPMGKLKKDIRNTVIPRDAVRNPIMTPEIEEQIRAERRARAEREREFKREQEETSKKLAPFLDPDSMASMLRKKKKEENLPPSADTALPPEEDPFEALAREMEGGNEDTSDDTGLPPTFDEALNLLREMRDYVPDEYDRMLLHLAYILDNFREPSIVRGNIADFYDRIDQIPSAASAVWRDDVDVATWKRLIGGFSHEDLEYMIDVI